MSDWILKNMPLSIFIGLRYLRARKTNRSISFFSAVSLLGLSLGVAAVVVVISVMNGFENEMHRRILGMIPHISIENMDSGDDKRYEINLDNWQGIAAGIKDEQAFGEEIKSVAPFVNLDGLINKNSYIKGLRVVGVDPLYEKKSTVFGEFMLAGSMDVLNEAKQNIILGSDIARDLGLIIGDEVTVIFPIVENSRLKSRFFKFRVSGFFDVGAEADGFLAFINIEDAALLKYQDSTIDGIRLQVHDVENVEQLTSRIKPFVDGQFRLDNWQSSYGQLFQTVKIEKVMTGAMLMMIVLVAAFNTVSSLSMLVAEKHTSVAVLRTMGFKSGEVVMIFFTQGLIISGLGVGIGLLSGLLIAFNIEAIISFINGLQLVWLAPLKSEVRWGDILWISVFAMMISLFASILPARKAAEIEPADAVRYN